MERHQVERLLINVDNVPVSFPDNICNRRVVMKVVRARQSAGEHSQFVSLRLDPFKFLIAPALGHDHRQVNSQPGKLAKLPVVSPHHQRLRNHQHLHAAPALSTVRFHNTDPASRQPRLKSRSAITLSSSNAKPYTNTTAMLSNHPGTSAPKARENP